MKTPRKLKPNLKKKVIELIKEDWSPQQIRGRLKLENQPFASRGTICKIIRLDKENGGGLWKHTRHKLKHRKRPVGKKLALKTAVLLTGDLQ